MVFPVSLRRPAQNPVTAFFGNLPAYVSRFCIGMSLHSLVSISLPRLTPRKLNGKMIRVIFLVSLVYDTFFRMVYEKSTSLPQASFLSDLPSGRGYFSVTRLFATFPSSRGEDNLRSHCESFQEPLPSYDSGKRRPATPGTRSRQGPCPLPHPCGGRPRTFSP